MEGSPRRAPPRPAGFCHVRPIRPARASASSARDASIYYENLSSDEGCFVRNQEVNGVRDLIDACQSPERGASGDALSVLLGHAPCHVPVKIAGRTEFTLI